MLPPSLTLGVPLKLKDTSSTTPETLVVTLELPNTKFSKLPPVIFASSMLTESVLCSEGAVTSTEADVCPANTTII